MAQTLPAVIISGVRPPLPTNHRRKGLGHTRLGRTRAGLIIDICGGVNVTSHVLILAGVHVQFHKGGASKLVIPS